MAQAPAPIPDYTVIDNPTIRSKPPREKQYDEDDQDDADHTYAAVTVTVSVSAKATAETAKQKDDKDDDEYGSNRHDLPLAAAPMRLN